MRLYLIFEQSHLMSRIYERAANRSESCIVNKYIHVGIRTVTETVFWTWTLATKCIASSSTSVSVYVTTASGQLTTKATAVGRLHGRRGFPIFLDYSHVPPLHRRLASHLLSLAELFGTSPHLQKLDNIH